LLVPQTGSNSRVQRIFEHLAFESKEIIFEQDYHNAQTFLQFSIQSRLEDNFLGIEYDIPALSAKNSESITVKNEICLMID